MSDVNIDIAAGLSIPLTTFALTFEQGGAIADKVAPVFPVSLRSSSFPVWDKKSLFSSGSAKVGVDGQIEEIKEKLGSDVYTVQDFARRISTPADALSEYAALGINKEQRDTKKIMNYLAVERESRAHTLFTTAGNYGANTAGPLAGTWDLAASTPLQDVARASRAILGAGMRKVMLMGRAVYDVVRFNAQVLSALGRPGGQTDREISAATKDDLARMFGVDEVCVSDLQFNNNNDGAATVDRQYIWSSKTAAVVVCPKAEEISGDTLTFAITFRYLRQQLAMQDFGGIPATAIVRRWFDENRGIVGSWQTVGGYSEDMKLVAPDAGFLLTAVIP